MALNLFFCFPQVSWQIVSIPTSHLLFFLQWLFLQQQHYFLFLFATENQHSLRPFTVLILKNISTEQREKQASNDHFWIKTKNYHLETVIIIIIILLETVFFPTRKFVWLWGWDVYIINILGVPGDKWLCPRHDMLTAVQATVLSPTVSNVHTWQFVWV